MKNLYTNKVNKRTFLLGIVFMFWFGILIFRLIQLQIFEHAELKRRIMVQNQKKDIILPKRGTIFDRSGHILARSIPYESIALTSSEGEAIEVQIQKVEKLKRILNLSSQETKKIISRIQKNAGFTWIKRKVPPELAQKVKDLDLGDLTFVQEPKRFYPQGKLAAHLLGRVNIDEKGQSGIEGSYESVLGGKPGNRLNQWDARQRRYAFEILEHPIPGKDIYLTMDETIQYIAYRELKRAYRQWNAEWGIVIVTHPPSGEILAMANYPSFDPNKPIRRISQADRNNSIHYLFDPGSTFKVVTASAALETQSVGLNEIFDCREGFRVIHGKTMRDHKKLGILSFPEVFIHSSNVGTTYIGEKIGDVDLFNMISAYGFGNKTGIDLPAEEKGLFHPVSKWSKISCAWLSVGYEIAVTPIQMMQALNIIANDGILIPLRLVRKIPTAPTQMTYADSNMRRVISHYSASQITHILERAVLEGTGVLAQIEGYRVAGKTGTAQKRDKTTGLYTYKAHISSFMGFAPIENPMISIIVVIDDPQGKYYGGDVAAPVFRAIATQVLDYLRIQKNYVDFPSSKSIDIEEDRP